MLQGIVQAVVTRWIGAVFIEYFQDEMVRENKTALTSLARREWEQLTTLARKQCGSSSPRRVAELARQEP